MNRISTNKEDVDFKKENVQNQKQSFKENKRKRKALATVDTNVNNNENNHTEKNPLKRRKASNENKASNEKKKEEEINKNEQNEYKNGLEQEIEVYKDYLDIDEINSKDPNYVSRYAPSIFESFFQRERMTINRPDIKYLDFQEEIVSHMREILIDWLVDVQQQYNLLSTTLYTCVSLFDRSLSLFQVQRKDLQLLGCACMLIAAKYEEVYHPTTADFRYISDYTYTIKQIVDMELKVLTNLDYRVTVPTPGHYFSRFFQAACSSSREMNICKYLCEASLSDYLCLQFLPSLMVASALYLSRLMLKRTEPWSSTLERYTSYKANELIMCCIAIQEAVRKNEKSKLVAIQNKYSSVVNEKVFLFVKDKHVDLKQRER